MSHTSNERALLPPIGINPADPPLAPVFDLSDATGSTDSERFLASLCRQSFLRLWSFPNTFTDEGVRSDGVSSGKEFVDVLVVFGDHVVLFSDKDIAFNEGIDVSVAWPRWFKSAVSKSARQLHGAMNWARRFPERIFLDAACTRPLPINLPPAERARFHLVATTRGSLDACARRYAGSLGTHLIDTRVVGNAHLSTPFTVGRLDPVKPFVHVFDEFSLETVLRERDTAADFITYLQARETFLTTDRRNVTAAGEEQLLAAYMSHMRGEEHWFLSDGDDIPEGGVGWFDESHLETLHARPEYRLKKEADRHSYFWDGLIDRFVTEGNPALLGATSSGADVERGLRIIASEGRFERRLLTEALRQLFDLGRATPGARRARTFSTEQRPEIAYVFLIDPCVPGESYEDYRRDRAAFLQVYCECARLRMPKATTIVGLAVDHPVKHYAGSSEDLAIFQWGEGIEPDMAALRRIADELGILPESLPLQRSGTQDFPQAPSRGAESRPELVRPTQKAKRRNAMPKSSRRKNRKK